MTLQISLLFKYVFQFKETGKTYNRAMNNFYTHTAINKYCNSNKKEWPNTC